MLFDRHDIGRRLLVLAQDDPLLLGNGLIDPQEEPLDREARVDEEVLDPAQRAEHGQAEELDDDVVAEPVGDQPGQAVAFRVHEAIGVGHRVELQDLPPHGHGPDDPLLDQLVGRHLGPAAEHPQNDPHRPL